MPTKTEKLKQVRNNQYATKRPHIRGYYAIVEGKVESSLDNFVTKTFIIDGETYEDAVTNAKQFISVRGLKSGHVSSVYPYRV